MTPLARTARLLSALTVGLVPLAAWAGEDAALVDRLITVVSSIVVPVALALLGHRLGMSRTHQQEVKERAKSGIFTPPPPAPPQTPVKWLTQVGMAAAPSRLLLVPTQASRKWMPLLVAAVLVASGAVSALLVSRLFAAFQAPQAAPLAPGFPIFDDKGEQFLRAGGNQGLEVGATLVVINARGEAAGKATVAEVWPTIARLQLDAAAASASSPLTAAPATRPSAGPATPVALSGRASLIGFGPASRVMVFNTGRSGWTHCELRLPNNRHYRLEALAADSSDGVMIEKFRQDGVERDVELSWVDVSCSEGSARFALH